MLPCLQIPGCHEGAASLHNFQTGEQDFEGNGDRYLYFTRPDEGHYGTHVQRHYAVCNAPQCYTVTYSPSASGYFPCVPEGAAHAAHVALVSTVKSVILAR